MVAEKFQISGVKITGRYAPKQNSLSGRSKNNLFPSNRVFEKSVFHSSEREEKYGAEKMTKVKLVKVLVTRFEKFHHLCNLYIFGFCFVVS